MAMALSPKKHDQWHATPPAQPAAPPAMPAFGPRMAFPSTSKVGRISSKPIMAPTCATFDLAGPRWSPHSQFGNAMRLTSVSLASHAPSRATPPHRRIFAVWHIAFNSFVNNVFALRIMDYMSGMVLTF